MRFAALVIAIVIAAASAIACSSTSTSTSVPPAAAATSSADQTIPVPPAEPGPLTEPATAPAQDPYASVPGIVHPTDVQTADYIAALRTIAPALAVKSDRAVRHARDICLDSYNDKAKGGSSTIRLAMARDDVDEETAKKMVTAARKTLCPGVEFAP